MVFSGPYFMKKVARLVYNLNLDFSKFVLIKSFWSLGRKSFLGF